MNKPEGTPKPAKEKKIRTTGAGLLDLWKEEGIDWNAVGEQYGKDWEAFSEDAQAVKEKIYEKARNRFTRRWVLRPYDVVRGMLLESEDFFAAGRQMVNVGPPNLVNATKRLRDRATSEYERWRINRLIKVRAGSKTKTAEINERAEAATAALDELTSRTDLFDQYVGNKIGELQTLLEEDVVNPPITIRSNFHDFDDLHAELFSVKDQVEKSIGDYGAIDIDAASIDYKTRTKMLEYLQKVLTAINNLLVAVNLEVIEINKLQERLTKQERLAYEASGRVWKREAALDHIERLRHQLHTIILKRIRAQRKLEEAEIRVDELSAGRDPENRRGETEATHARLLKGRLERLLPLTELFADKRKIHAKLQEVADVTELGRRPLIFDIEKEIEALVLSPSLRDRLEYIMAPHAEMDETFKVGSRYRPLSPERIRAMLEQIDEDLGIPQSTKGSNAVLEETD